MASKYLQKYPVPEGFYDILHDFTREILRAQPEDIIEYAANYFEHKSQGKEYVYESKFNVPKPVDKYDMANKKNYDPKPHQQYADQARKVVEVSNNKENKINKQNTGQSMSDKPNDISKHSRESDVSFIDEKKATKDFVQEMYNSAIQKVVISEESQQNQQQENDQSESDHEEVQKKKQEDNPPQQKKEEVVLDGPLHEYENAALLIQAKYRSDKMKKQ